MAEVVRICPEPFLGCALHSLPTTCGLRGALLSADGPETTPIRTVSSARCGHQERGVPAAAAVRTVDADYS